MDATATSPDRIKSLSLAILSGSKIVVWDLSTSIGGIGRHQVEDDFRTFYPYPQYETGLPMSSLAWNHNQMVIATSSGISTDDCAHDNIVLLSSLSGETLQSFRHDSGWKQKHPSGGDRDDDESSRGNAVRSVSFGGKSRYLCIGDESGAVHLWDLKKKIPVRHFLHAKQPPPSTTNAAFRNGGVGVPSCPSNQVSLDPTHTYILSLSPSALYLYNLREGQLAGTFTLPTTDDGIDIDVAHFTIFSISDLEPNLCAVGTDDGRIYVHDINSDRNRQQSPSPHLEMTQRHSGDVTGLAFSPVRNGVFFSSGKDGAIFRHDISNETSRKIGGALESNNSPIRSMSVHANGDMFAIGCKSGDVFVYAFQNSAAEDGEPSTTLLASFQANEPIGSLFFAPPPRQKDVQKQQDKTKSNDNVSESRSGATSQTTTTTTTTSQSTKATAPMDSESSGKQPEPKKMTGVYAVEPRRDNNHPPGTTTPMETEKVETRVPPTGPATGQSQKPPSARSAAAQTKNTKPRHPSPFARKLAQLTVSAAKRAPDAKPQKTAAVDAGRGRRVETVRPPAKRLPASPAHHKHSARIPTGGEPAQTDNIPDARRVGEINIEEIREVVREEVEDLQDDMEEQLRNLHIDMINQFHQQSREIQSLLSRHSAALDRLTAENRLLREENERYRRGQPG